MNLLFLLRSLDIGGVEVVTAVLANKFLKEGHRVGVFAFEEGGGYVKTRFDGQIKFIIGAGYRNSQENIGILRQQLLDCEVDIVINQWGLPLIPIKVLNRARKGLDVKIISVYHNDPNQNARMQSVMTAIDKTENSFVKVLLNVKKQIFKYVTSYAMGYNYRHSDSFVLLSPSFVSNFQLFTKQKDINKLIVQTNPVTIDIDKDTYDVDHKQKEIIYVGRLDEIQKRVQRVIETWALLEHHHPDWCLTIVGDGEERKRMEQMAKNLDLQRVNFEGFQFPKTYYERASILLLTSEFEGFPLVLTECMSFGVIPVVYGSYSAVYDIIENDKDGIILPHEKLGFRADLMAERLGILMNDKVKRNDMAIKAIEKSQNYSIDTIYQQWMKILSR